MTISTSYDFTATLFLFHQCIFGVMWYFSVFACLCNFSQVSNAKWRDQMADYSYKQCLTTFCTVVFVFLINHAPILCQGRLFKLSAKTNSHCTPDASQVQPFRHKSGKTFWANLDPWIVAFFCGHLFLHLSDFDRRKAQLA